MVAAAQFKPNPTTYALITEGRETVSLPTHPQMRPGWIAYKRIQDITLSLIIIAVVLIPLLIIALAIKFDSPGRVLFRQNRRGLHGVLFPCFKLRTMHEHFSDPDATVQSIRNDPRTTRIGCHLRRTSLDELPQIFNVLRGEMSIVGPRPHAPGTNVDGRLLPDINDSYLTRYSVKPGITGWAQVNGWRGILDTEEKLVNRLEHDLHYITHWTPWLDIKILIKTVFCLFSKHAF